MELSDIYSQFFDLPLWLVTLIALWTIVWKGFALWKSARKNSPIWFIALLIINTFGILEVLYIFLFSKIKLNKIDKALKKKKTAKKARK